MRLKILQRYILLTLTRNIGLCLLVSVILFLIFDFFDRIDNIIAAKATLWLTVQYFVFKTPFMLVHMLPVSIMIGTILTFGILSKNSEVIAMRASGLRLSWIAYPLLLVGAALCIFSFALSEFVVPSAQRRAREIYNIDIRGKDRSGGYSQSEFWWRSGESFFSVDTFDSRSNTIYNLSRFQIDQDFNVRRRTDAQSVFWLDNFLGWNMRQVTEYFFDDQQSSQQVKQFKSLPLPIGEKPQDFYEAKTDPDSMNYSQLSKFIKRQLANGIGVSGYMADLHEKLAFPVFNLIVALVVLPFALKSARSKAMAGSVLAAMIVGFSYYAVHSFSLALGRAELIPPFIAAWMANALMAFVALVLMLGAEAPS